MDKIIAYCGGFCHTCAIFLATKEKNDKKKHEMRVEIAQQINEMHRTEKKADDIPDCDGCRAEDDRLINKDCQIRKCTQEKDLECCTSCPEYICEKLEKS